MPIQTLLILLAVVIAAAGLTVALMQGVGMWVAIPLMVAALAVRLWMARS
ncbi:MAG: hypothetical protein ABF248_12005 [Yoonia sp.]